MLHEELPVLQCSAGLCIKRVDGQLGVYSLTSFAEGATVFEGVVQTRETPADTTKATARLQTASGEWVEAVPSIHWVPINDKQSHVYTFDCFMNHSCNANTQCLFDGAKYWHVAARAIEPGDQVTVDYRSVYPSDRLPAFDCACGAVDCSWP
jgi:SET domain